MATTKLDAPATAPAPAPAAAAKPEVAKPEVAKPVAAKPEVPKTVRLQNLTEGYVGPKEADVHPDEVKNWVKHGWQPKE